MLAGSAGTAARDALDLVPADPRRAALQAGRALQLAERERDLAAQSLAHRALGLAAREVGDLTAALTALRAAVRVAERGELPVLAAQARMSRAFVLLSQGKVRVAIRDAESSVADLRGADRARALAQYGLILQRAGHLDHALAVYAPALSALRRHRDKLWEARLRNNRGILYRYRGQLRRAKADITRAEQLYATLQLPRAQAGARWNLGVVEGTMGDIPAALDALDAAADAFRKADVPAAALLLDQGEVLLSAGLAHEGLETVSAAVAELSKRGQHADLAEARLLLARARLAAGEPGAAAADAGAARQSFARQHRPSWSAMAQYVEVHAMWAAGDRSERLLRAALRTATRLSATGWTTAALDIRLLAGRIATDVGRLAVADAQLRTAARARRSVQLDQRARAWYALALLRHRNGDQRGAYRAVCAGLDAAEQHRALLGATELRVQVAGQVADLAALGVDLALAHRDPGRVLRSAERYRAATLRLRPVLPPADEGLADLLARLRVAAAEAERAQLNEAAARPLRRRQRALEDELRRRLRHSRGAPAPLPPSAAGTSHLAADLAAALGDRVLIEYLERAGRMYAVVLRDGAATLRALEPAAGPATIAAELESLRFAWHRTVTGHGSDTSLRAAASLVTHAAARLDDMLLRPLAPLPDGRPLVLVPTGQLQSVPWLMLPGCAGRSVTVAPSAATWLAAAGGPGKSGTAAARPPGGSAGHAVLVAGPGLPGAAREVAALSALYPDARVLTGPDATVGATLRALDGAAIAHIAAHGRFREDNPLFSALMLADGPLTVYDLERLGAAPAAIMLAACDSAMSPVRPGDEMTGLAAALLAVGTRTVVAPLLPVPDDTGGAPAHTWHRLVRQGTAPAAALCVAARDEAATALICLGFG